MKKEHHQHFEVSDFVLDDSFLKWVRNEDPEAVRKWGQWAAANQKAQGEINQALRLVQAMKFEETTVTTSEIGSAWQKLLHGPDLGNSHPYRQNKRQHTYLNSLAGIAATLLAIVTFIFFARHFTQEKPPGASSLVQIVVKENPKGQKLSIVLPDGTQIKLNSGSKLTYTSDFAQKSREVTLEGEAFFDVAYNAALPFVVHSENVSATVLGTSFNINAYPENKVVKVALVSGRIRVGHEGQLGKIQKTVLKPRQMATIDVADALEHVTTFDPIEITGWKDGILCFQRAKLSNTIHKLDRWYGVDITMEEGMETGSDWLFSGSFKNRSLEYVLNTLSYPDLFSFSIKGKKVVIKPYEKKPW